MTMEHFLKLWAVYGKDTEDRIRALQIKIMSKTSDWFVTLIGKKSYTISWISLEKLVAYASYLKVMDDCPKIACMENWNLLPAYTNWNNKIQISIFKMSDFKKC